MNNKSLPKKCLIILTIIILSFSLFACTTTSGTKKPNGLYLNTKVDFGDGLSPVLSGFTEECLNFKKDGSGTWTLSFDMDFRWKLKEDKLLITREIFNKKETYKAIWDGEKILLDYDGVILLFEKKHD